MKKLGRKGRGLLTLLLICACVFSQVLFAFASKDVEESTLIPSLEDQTEAEPVSEESSEPEDGGGRGPATVPEIESQGQEDKEPTEEASKPVEETSGLAEETLKPAEPSTEILPEATEPETELQTEESLESAAFYGADETAVEETAPTIEYRTHVQTYGWSQGWVSNGKEAGTEGESKRLEAIEIKVKDTKLSGDIEYQTHVQSIGWQGWKKNGEMSGTEQEYKRLEGIRIRLTGELAQNYDVYYCVHVQTLGWLDWAKNGEMAGTSGLAKRLESIKIVLVEKGGKAPAPMGLGGRSFASLPGVAYRSHVQSYGTMDWVSDGQTCGVTGQSKRMEAIAVKLTGETNLPGDIEYRTHVQSYGWRGWTNDHSLNGSEGEAKRVEAVQLRLTGEVGILCDIYYRVHVEGYGWLGWTKNGELAGTSGLALRLEAIEIKIERKGLTPVWIGDPAYHEYTGPGYYQIGDKNVYYSDNGRQGDSRTGWVRENGNRYYLVNGARVTGWRYIGGLKYYFNDDGSLCQNVDGIIGPQSNYMIKLNKEANCITVYASDGANGYIIPVKAMLCSSGPDTPLGTFRTPVKYRWRTMLNGTHAQFATRLTEGQQFLFHSLMYDARDNRTLSQSGYPYYSYAYNNLGLVASAGCIRLQCGEAYWIYARCPLGTTVVVYNDPNPGPFDRPVVTAIPENQRWDPTDPFL